MKRIFLLVLCVLMITTLASCGGAYDAPDFTIDENGNLIVRYPDGTQQILGQVRPQDGQPGEDGEDGADGAPGTPGKDGADGVGIQELQIVNNELIVTYTNGQRKNLGTVVGKDGKEIVSIRIIDGKWHILYDNGTEEIVIPETESDTDESSPIVDGGANTEGGWGPIHPVS